MPAIPTQPGRPGVQPGGPSVQFGGTGGGPPPPPTLPDIEFIDPLQVLILPDDGGDDPDTDPVQVVIVQ